MSKIRRALISVFDKSGLIPFAQLLSECGVEILSTGGTASILREYGIPVLDVSTYTGCPEILDGRVKTLHPRVHGGILFVRDKGEHVQQLELHQILPIDLVVVNLYPFEQVAARPDTTVAELIENIDIGGPSMIRSAAKNYQYVTVVVDPLDYAEVARQIRNTGETTLELRQRLALKAFARTAAYDAAIAAQLSKVLGISPSWDTQQPRETIHIYAPLAQRLRYGENPHQEAALYGWFYEYFEQIQGKELSYNNILDLTSAAALIYEFWDENPTVAILKHTNPCGVGQGSSLVEAWEKAFATDRHSPFGGIIVANRPIDGCLAAQVEQLFCELIIAPDFSADALAVLGRKKNLRLMRLKKDPRHAPAWEVRSIGAGSYLWQERDLKSIDTSHWKVVSHRQPEAHEWQAMIFGWKVVKHVKSNAVVFVGQDRTLGIGAGQMSRVDAVKVAAWKAEQEGLSLRGSVVASDAFFPFADGVETAARYGASAVIQPGGSIRDEEVIDAADRLGLAMVFTGERHFRH